MMLIEEYKAKHLILRKFSERIASILLYKLFDYLSYVKKDVVWWLFKMGDLVGGELGSIYIWTQDKYAKFTGRLSRQPEIEKRFSSDLPMRKKMKRKGRFLN